MSGRSQLFLPYMRWYVQIVKRNQFLLSGRLVFHFRYQSARKLAFNRPEKQFPNFNYLWKQTLKSGIVLFKLCKKNHRMQSRISDVLFLIEFHFETIKQVFLLQDFEHLHIAIRPHIFSTYNDIRGIVERTPHSHIQRCFCRKSLFSTQWKHDVHELIFLFRFFCQNYCISCSFFIISFFALNSIILFQIASSLTFTNYLSARVKPIQNIVTKTKKTYSDIILAQLRRSVAGNIVVSKKILLPDLCNIEYCFPDLMFGFTRFLYKIYLNR